MFRKFLSLVLLSTCLSAGMNGQNFDFCYQCFGTTGDCAFPAIADNPELMALCAEMHIILIIDESGSVAPYTDQVENGVLQFTNALVGTGVSMAVIEFDSSARLVTDYLVVDNDVLADMTGYFNGTPFNGQTYAPFEGTNWMRAMLEAIDLEPADLVLFFTDGNPTVYTNMDGEPDRCGFGFTTQRPEIVNPMLIANYIKSMEGTHIFMMGVGDVADSVELRTNLQRMSGPIEWEPGVTDFQSSDYALGNFSTLALELRAFAIEICGTETNVSFTPDRDSVCIGETVVFTVEVTNTGMENAAQSLVIRDTLPVEFANIEVVAGSGACVGSGCDPDEPGNVLFWQVGNLAPSETATLIIQATMTGSGSFMNPLWVTGGNVDSVAVIWSVVVVPPPEADAGPDQMICPGDEAILNATATGGYGDYNFTWSTTDTTAMITVSPDVTSNYTVTVTDRNGCADTDVVQVMLKVLPQLNMPDTVVECAETEFTLNENGNPDWTYIWSPAEFLDDPASPSPTASVPVSMLFSVTIDDGMCIAMDEVFIDVIPIADVHIGDVDTSCFGAPIVLNPGGDPNFTYQWSPAEFLNDPTLPSPIADIDTSTTFYVTITNLSADQCSRYDSILIFVPPDIDLGAPDDTAYCEAPPITLTATGTGVEFVWYDESGTQIGTGPTITVMPLVETTYILEGTDIFGCEVQENIRLSPTFFDYEITDDPIICEGETITLSVINHAPAQILSFLWEPADEIIGPNDQESILVSPSESTTYIVTITNDVGCVMTDTIDVTVGSFDPDSLEIYVSSDTIVIGEFFEISTNQSPDLFYFWDGSNINNPNLPVITVSPLSPGSYTFAVTVTNDFGCELTGLISNLTVLDPLCNMEDIFIPDAFSPNGDGNNDQLFVYGNYITSMELVIYNRWGEKVFETRDQSIGWDGTYKGKELPPDVFGYYLRAECPPDKSYFTKGNITLLK